MMTWFSLKTKYVVREYFEAAAFLFSTKKNVNIINEFLFFFSDHCTIP